MPVNKRIGYGMTLGVDTAGGASFTTLGALVDGTKESDAKGTTGDTSILTDVFMTFSKSQVDPGETSFTIAYDPDEATSTTLKALLASTNATAPTWRITFPAGTLGAGTITTKTFSAHLTGMGREVMKDNLVTASITLKKTGDPGM